MGIGVRKTRKLLNYQLNDFLELKLKESERKLISKVKQAILRSPYFEGSSLYEFPAIGTKKVCFVLSNGFSEKLRTLCFMNSDGSFKEIELR